MTSFGAVHPASLTKSVAAAILGVDREVSIRFQTIAEYLDYYYIRERLLANGFSDMALFTGIPPRPDVSAP